jgi:hypothetical protein
MPDQQALKYIVSKNAADLQQIRLPGLTKPLEELTISELVQLRPGGTGADDAGNINVNAVGSDVTISTSSALSELAQIRGQEAVRAELALSRVGAGIAAGKQIDVKFPAEPLVQPAKTAVRVEFGPPTKAP